MSLSASKLRKDIYNLLDQVLQTGKPLEVTRKGRRLRIVPVDGTAKLCNLNRHDCLEGDPEDIVHVDWSDEWRP